MRQLLHSNIVPGRTRRRENRSTAAAALPVLAPEAGPSSHPVPFSGPGREAGLSGHVTEGGCREGSEGGGGVVVVEGEDMFAASPVADTGAPETTNPPPNPQTLSAKQRQVESN